MAGSRRVGENLVNQLPPVTALNISLSNFESFLQFEGRRKDVGMGSQVAVVQWRMKYKEDVLGADLFKCCYGESDTQYVRLSERERM